VLRSHLTRTLRPFTHHFLNVFIAGEIATFRFGQALADLFNLPLVEGDVFADGFSGEKGACTAGSLGQFV